MEQENIETPESPEVALEKLRVKRLELEARSRREQREAVETREQTKRVLFAENLRRELASIGIEFHVSDAELRTILEGTSKAKFLVRNDGQFTVEVGGKQAVFADLIQQFAASHPYLASSDISHLTKPKERLSREDFPDAASKSRAIAENGLAWWDALPATRLQNATKETLTLEAWRSMNTRQKSAMNLSEVEISRLRRHGKL
jgi:hypothetical protein